jgi:exodeoxyribonuclease VII large subunit
LSERLDKQMQLIFEQKQRQFQQTLQSLDLLSPLKIMGRGYSYTTKETVVKSVQELAVGDFLDVHYQDGQAKVEVLEIKEEKHDKSNI